jgi:hypothetical protein
MVVGDLVRRESISCGEEEDDLDVVEADHDDTPHKVPHHHSKMVFSPMFCCALVSFS